MEFIQNPIEQTTAATDFILGGLAACFAYSYYQKVRLKDKNKALIWTAIFCLLAIAAFLGAIVHGFETTEQTKFILWQPLSVAILLMIGAIGIATFYDLKGLSTLNYTLPTMLLVSFFFFALTLYFQKYLIIIIFEGLVLFFALGAYTVLGYTNQLKGAWYIAVGILVSIVAAVLQTQTGLSLKIIWEFNHNGIYHLVQMVGSFLMFMGLKKEIG